MIPARLFLLFSLICTLAAGAPSPLALQDGELLNYRVSWGIFPHAGEITIKARAENADGVPCTAVTTTTSTRGILRKLFTFEAQAESVFDQRTGRMIAHTESSAGGRKKTSTALEIDYATDKARFTDFVNAANSETIDVPPEGLMDLIMSLVQTRVWDLKPGDTRDISVIFEKDVYLLTVHALRYEEITTRLGSFNTLLLEPRMDKMAPKGMFKRGSQVHVWIAQNDEQHLPVRFEVEFKFGAGVATLERYEPPASVAKSSEPDKAPRS